MPAKRKPWVKAKPQYESQQCHAFIPGKNRQCKRKTARGYFCAEHSGEHEGVFVKADADSTNVDKLTLKKSHPDAQKGDKITTIQGKRITPKQARSIVQRAKQTKPKTWRQEEQYMLGLPKSTPGPKDVVDFRKTDKSFGRFVEKTGPAQANSRVIMNPKKIGAKQTKFKIIASEMIDSGDMIKTNFAKSKRNMKKYLKRKGPGGTLRLRGGAGDEDGGSGPPSPPHTPPLPLPPHLQPNNPPNMKRVFKPRRIPSTPPPPSPSAPPIPPKPPKPPPPTKADYAPPHNYTGPQPAYPSSSAADAFQLPGPALTGAQVIAQDEREERINTIARVLYEKFEPKHPKGAGAMENTMKKLAAYFIGTADRALIYYIAEHGAYPEFSRGYYPDRDQPASNNWKYWPEGNWDPAADWQDFDFYKSHAAKVIRQKAYGKGQGSAAYPLLIGYMAAIEDYIRDGTPIQVKGGLFR